jgi:hypothetical protein
MIRVLLLTYLVGTLSATGLAKLHHRHGTALGLIRERVLRPSVARASVWWIGGAELLLAAGLAFNVERKGFLLATSALFVMFAIYHAMVAVKTRSLMCSCSGPKAAISPASVPAITGTCVGNLLPAAAALWIMTSGAVTGAVDRYVVVAAWCVPALIWLVARLRRQTPRSLSTSPNGVSPRDA